jgi:purine-binding chemotaxis protein CheW
MSITAAEAHAVDQLVVFHLAGEEYALPIGQINEVIRYTPPRQVASRDPFTIGVISLRGTVLPVGDLAGRLGLSIEHTDDSKIVIVERDSQSAGVVVDAIDEVLSVEADRIDTTSIPTQDIVSGIARLDQRLVVILDGGALLGDLPEAA